MLGRRTRIALAAVMAAIALPATAEAASITFSGGVLSYDGGPVANNTSFSIGTEDNFGCGQRPAPCIDVQEGGTSTITFPADRCADDGLYTVECDLPASVVVNAGEGIDSVFAADLPTQINGGGGNDTVLKGGAATDTITGGPGNDLLTGMGANDTLDGGDGDDFLEGYAGDLADAAESTRGSDVLIGGPGKDHVDYEGRTDPLTISLNGAPDDGAAGEADNVGTDVEEVRGGNADDTLIGNGATNALDGSTGNDTIRAGDGDDSIFGRAGNDHVFGEGGQDAIEGGDGDDEVVGGDGTDILYGDQLQTCIPGVCATGRDSIAARDGAADEVYCGPGQDSATVDRVDRVTSDTQDACEQVDTTGPTGGGGAPQISGLRVGRVRPGRTTTIRFTLSAPATVTFRVERQVRRRGSRRYKKLPGRLAAQGAAGANSATWDGRVNNKRLKAGRYRMVAVATDAAGNRGRARRATFRAVR